VPERMLILSRIGAWSLNSLTNQLGMGTYAHTFIGDDIDAWIESATGVKALINGRPVATIDYDSKYMGERLPSRAAVEISSVYGLVRPKYLSVFNPFEYGVIPNHGQNWMGDKFPDITADILLEDAEQQIPGLFAPRAYIPRHTTPTRPRVIGSMDRKRH